MNLDFYFFNLINGLAGRWQLLDVTGIFFATYFEYILLAILLLFLVKDVRKYWRMVAEALTAAFFVRFILVKILHLVWFRPRPFVYNHVNLLIDFNAQQTSFPSGHASFYFALSTIIYAYSKKVGTAFYIGSSLIVISRVFVGVHWLSDILAGMLLGIIMGIILNLVFKKIHPLKVLEKIA